MYHVMCTMKKYIGFTSRYRLYLLFFSAFLIRLIHLNQSLWLDEATTAIVAKTYSYIGIIAQFSPHDFHPPLYYLFIKLWTSLFGYSEIALRMPSVLFSLGTGLAIYLLVRKYESRMANAKKTKDTIPFWSAAFFLFNPLIIYYSQEARMYSMTTFLIALSFYFFLRFSPSDSGLKNPMRSLDYWLMNFFLTLSFFTFYASIFYIASLYVYLVWTQKHRVSTLLSILVVGLGILSISPLLYQQYVVSREALVSVTNWSLVLGQVTMKNLFLFPIKFTSGRVSFFPKSMYYLLSGGWTLFVALIMIAGFRIKSGMKKDIRIILYFLLTPLILGVLFSFNSPLLQYFRFQYLIVFLSIFLGIVANHPQPALGIQTGGHINSGLTRYALLVGFISWSLLYLVFPQYHREDWQSLSTELKNETAPIFMVSSSSDPVKYYAPEITVNDLRSLSTIDSGLESKMETKGNSIIIVPYTAFIHGVDYKQILVSNGYFQESTQVERGLTYEKWILEVAEN